MTTLRTLSYPRVPREPILPSYGLVGLFDVLGYKSLLRENNVKEAFDIITEAFVKVPKEMEYNLGPVALADPDLVPKHLVFSDSILVYTPWDRNKPLGKRVPLHFLLFCRGLFTKLFVGGLPLRGAIAVGEYFVRDACFAGTPILEAYEEGNRLQLAGCMVLDSAMTNLKDLDIESMVFEYDVPLNGKPGEQLKGKSFMLKTNVTTCVSVQTQFQAHKKRIDCKSVQDKINNTVNFFELCAHQDLA